MLTMVPVLGSLMRRRRPPIDSIRDLMFPEPWPSVVV